MTLLGHNGAGKSTLIGYLLGFYNRLEQHPFLSHYANLIEPLDRAQTGYAPESPWLEESANAREYLELMAPLKGVKTYDAAALFERVGLRADPKAPIRAYSKGMKQRLLLALALLGDPKTLILDEPTSGLDPFGRDEIEILLLELAKNHRLIISTHSLELAWKLDQEVWILREGQVAHRGRFESFEALKNRFFELRPARID